MILGNREIKFATLIFYFLVVAITASGCATPNILCADGCRTGKSRSQEQWSPTLRDTLVRSTIYHDLFIHQPTGAMEVAHDCGNPSTVAAIVYAMVPVVMSEVARLEMGSDVLRAESMHRGSKAVSARQHAQSERKCERAMDLASRNNANPNIVMNVEHWLEVHGISNSNERP